MDARDRDGEGEMGGMDDEPAVEEVGVGGGEDGACCVDVDSPSPEWLLELFVLDANTLLFVVLALLPLLLEVPKVKLVLLPPLLLLPMLLLLLLLSRGEGDVGAEAEAGEEDE